MTDIDVIMVFLLIDTIGLALVLILSLENNRILRKKKNKIKNNEADHTDLWRTKENGK